MSANPLNFEQSKNLSFGKGLTDYQSYQSHKYYTPHKKLSNNELSLHQKFIITHYRQFQCINVIIIESLTSPSNFVLLSWHVSHLQTFEGRLCLSPRAKVWYTTQLF